eukprot:scaffold71990_cov65-Phaeocystis_antarctica.AAC.11
MPCTISTRTSSRRLWPRAAACCAAVSTEITRSPSITSSSSGNESTSVGWSLPRHWQLSSAMASSLHRVSDTCASGRLAAFSSAVTSSLASAPMLGSIPSSTSMITPPRTCSISSHGWSSTHGAASSTNDARVGKCRPRCAAGRITALTRSVSPRCAAGRIEAALTRSVSSRSLITRASAALQSLQK